MALNFPGITPSTSQPFYSTSPVNASAATVAANGTVTLQFQAVPSSQAFTGTISIVAQTGILAGSTWTATRDGTTPFLQWEDTQIPVDVQCKDGQTLSVQGTGLTPGQKVSATWTGINEDMTGPVSIVSPYVSGAPSAATLTQAMNNANIQANITNSNINANITNSVIDITPQSGFIPNAQNAQIATFSAQTIAASSSLSTSVINVQNYNSYSFSLTAYCTSQGTAGAPLTSQVLLTWYQDAAGTQPIYQERWYGWLGNGSGTATPLVGRGPMAGPYMKVTVFNNSSAATLTVGTEFLWGMAAPIAESRWRQNPPSGMNSGLSTLIPLPGSFGDDGFLSGIVSFVMGVSSNNWMPLPLFSGNTYWTFSTSVALNHTFVAGVGAALTNGQPQPGVGTPGLLWAPPGTAGTTFNTELIAPRAPLYFVISSTATAPTVTIVVTGQEQ